MIQEGETCDFALYQSFNLGAIRQLDRVSNTYHHLGLTLFALRKIALSLIYFTPDLIRLKSAQISVLHEPSFTCGLRVTIYFDITTVAKNMEQKYS